MEFDYPHVGLGEPIESIPWHARPLKELLKYRIWYKRPDGERFGLLSGTSVSYSSDFWVTVPAGTKITRSVENFVAIPTTQRGDYVVAIEAVFIDGEEQEYRRIFSTKYKTPLTTLDLSSIVPNPIDGIDFDSDQKLWVKSGSDYYQIGLHTDIMLIDYANKIIYFKENYHPGWTATVNGEKAPVYNAGLGFMYIPVPSESRNQTSNITLNFRGSLTTWSLPLLSLLALLLALIYSLTTRPFKAIDKHIYKKLVIPIKYWWSRE